MFKKYKIKIKKLSLKKILRTKKIEYIKKSIKYFVMSFKKVLNGFKMNIVADGIYF